MKHKLSTFLLIIHWYLLIPTYLFSQNNYVANIIQPEPIETPSICMVSVNKNNENLIIWEKPIDSNIDYYKIYRESTQQTGKWDYIGHSNYFANSIFIDSTSEPLKQANKYKISAVDKCGNETYISTNHHKTINLSILKSKNNNDSLVWDEYEGFTVNNYRIYRGSTIDNLKLIGSATADKLYYIDNSTSVDMNYYQIEVVSPSECNINKPNSTIGYIFSRSNIVSILNTGAIKTTMNSYIFVQPNPFNDRATLNFDNPNQSAYLLIIYDVTGNIVRSQSINNSSVEIVRDGLSNGLYFIELKGNNLIKGKFVISN